jgi:hypothetical protein
MNNINFNEVLDAIEEYILTDNTKYVIDDEPQTMLEWFKEELLYL